VRMLVGTLRGGGNMWYEFWMFESFVCILGRPSESSQLASCSNWILRH
jgi:hypothetical protein